jgi:hypothetical protein
MPTEMTTTEGDIRLRAFDL